MSTIRRRAIEGIRVGDVFVVSRTFSERDTAAFAELSRDYNPVHFDGRFAELRFKDRISHGLLVGSLLTEVGGQIGCLASGMTFSFRKPVYFGDTIVCRFTVTELDERLRAKAVAVFTNQDEEVVIEAHLTGILPGPEQREIMETIVSADDSAHRSKKN